MSHLLRWPRGLIYYGWIVVAITFATGLVSAGIRSSTTVFIQPLEAEFGWSKAAISGAISLNLLLFGVGAPISGRLIDRFGPRLVMLGSLFLSAVGVAGTIVMTHLWQLNLLWGIVIGLGAGGGASVLSATVATRWFVAHRGLVVGILGTATSTGQLLFLPLLMVVIVHFGWRAGSLLLATIALALLLPIMLWMRDDPAQVGLSPQGADQSGPTRGLREETAAVPLLQAVRTQEFWLLAGSLFVCGATANGLVGTHLIPHSIHQGIPEVTAAATVGVMGGVNFVGTLISGWATDRTDPRKVLALVYTFRGLSLFVLPFVTDFSGLFLFALLYGLDWFASVPPTVALTAARFGKRSVGSIYGWIFLSHQVGAATSAALGGAVFVWLGNYQAAFLAGGIVALIGATMVLLIQAHRPALEAVPLAGAAG